MDNLKPIIQQTHRDGQRAAYYEVAMKISQLHREPENADYDKLHALFMWATEQVSKYHMAKDAQP